MFVSSVILSLCGRITRVLLMMRQQFSGQVYGLRGLLAVFQLERQLAQRRAGAGRGEGLALAQGRPQARPGRCTVAVISAHAQI